MAKEDYTRLGRWGEQLANAAQMTPAPKASRLCATRLAEQAAGQGRTRIRRRITTSAPCA
eukprot:2902888-Rhodomonas_salina.2